MDCAVCSSRDPEEFSLLSLVDFFATVGNPGEGEMYRIKEGNDRLASELAKRLRRRPLMRTVFRGVRHRAGRAAVSLESASGLGTQDVDYVVVAVPPANVRDVTFDPELPEPQREAFGRLRTGAATRLLVQVSSRFWKQPGRPRAFGTDQATGAVWDGNEQQPGPPAMLSFLAGGHASRELQDIVRDEGLTNVLRRADWLRRRGAKPARILASRTVVWENDPWSRGGYAVFDTAFDPVLRDWLARPAGRVDICRRAHESPVAGIHQRRDRQRSSRGGGSGRACTTSAGVTMSKTILSSFEDELTRTI